MKGIHKFNLQCSSLMFILFIIMMIVDVKEGLLIGAIFGYIYACFMNLVYDLKFPEDEVSQCKSKSKVKK